MSEFGLRHLKGKGDAYPECEYVLIIGLIRLPVGILTRLVGRDEMHKVQ